MKIRKTIQIIAAAMLFVLVVGCSSIPEPVKAASERVSEECRPYAEQAVRIYDQYLGFEITRDAAAQAMQDLWSRAQHLDGRYEFGVNWRILMDIQFGHLEFSEFLGKTDEDIQDEALYKKTDEHPYGSDVVYYQPDPLAPEEAADFFLACLPE